MKSKMKRFRKTKVEPTLDVLEDFGWNISLVNEDNMNMQLTLVMEIKK